jgi:hypothetical protein
VAIWVSQGGYVQLGWKVFINPCLDLLRKLRVLSDEPIECLSVQIEWNLQKLIRIDAGDQGLQAGKGSLLDNIHIAIAII